MKVPSTFREMQTRPLLKAPSFLLISFIVLAIIVSLVAGLSGFVYPLPYSSLIVGGAFTATVLLITWVRKPVWALYAAVFLVLLPIGLIPPTIHSYLNRSMTVVALALLLFDMLVRRRRVQWTATATFMLGFATWSTVTLLWAGNQSIGMTMVQTYILRLILFLFLIPNAITTRHRVNGLMNTLALNGWVLMAAGAGTVLLEGYTSGTRLKVLGMNENEMGILALVTMIGVLWPAIQPSPRHKRLKVLASWVFLLGTIGLVSMSGSRGSSISLVVTLFLFLIWKPTRHWGVLGLMIIGFGLIAAPIAFSTIIERFTNITSASDSLLGGRDILASAAWLLIQDHPLIGVGIGNAPYAMMSTIRLFRSVTGETAVIHNPVLTIWLETGIPGIILYLGVFISAIWSYVLGFKRYQKVGSNKIMNYFYLSAACFLGFLVSWIKGGGMESDHSYFLMLALLLIPACLDLEGQREKRAMDNRTVPVV
jgi:putative inorganic carbon (hco3(-)) transporter